jgi:putative transposase
MEKVKPELVDELLKGYEKPEDIIGENGLLKRLTKALLERAMNAELTNHLGYEKHDPVGHNSGNSRNGATSKTVKGEFGEIVVETPRDRNGSFAPQILSKHQTRFDGFDDKILSMYARGMSTREIQSFQSFRVSGVSGVSGSFRDRVSGVSGTGYSIT